MDPFNTVDATYRADLRELNELNFARFEAKLDQRLERTAAQLREEFRTGLQGLRSELKDEIHGLRVELHAELHGLKAELIKWMFLFWAGTALGGLLLR